MFLSYDSFFLCLGIIYSYENLLFSICRFREVTGSYPSRITVIGFDFKQKRFTDLHRKAIRFPIEKFRYVGLVPSATFFDHSKAAMGELSAVSAFENDLYGCHTLELSQKKEKRNPFKRSIPYALACPELNDLLAFCGPELYQGLLPWSSAMDQVGKMSSAERMSKPNRLRKKTSSSHISS